MELALSVVFVSPKWVDLSLLLLRVIVAAVYLGSGWSFVSDPAGHSKSMGLSRSFTIFLGLAEIFKGLGLGVGVLLQFAAAGLILVMFGALYKKMFVWKTGFWGTSSQGWHYDLLFIAANMVILTTDGGRYILWK